MGDSRSAGYRAIQRERERRRREAGKCPDVVLCATSERNSELATVILNYPRGVHPVADVSRGPQNHRTVDRVTQILEEVTYHPGITFAELARALDAPKSSVHGFVRGLLAKGWVYETDKRFYLGAAIYGLTLASGQMQAGSVTQRDLDKLHELTGLNVFLGVQAGDHLIYVSVAGADAQSRFTARTHLRRGLLAAAGGKALLAEKSDAEHDSYLRRQPSEDGDMVAHFLAEYQDIKRTGIATNMRYGGAQFALATVVRNQFGEAVSAITLAGPAADAVPREAELRELLLDYVRGLAPRIHKAPAVL
jgi:DNA-binding IclR family transcriptional regulator